MARASASALKLLDFLVVLSDKRKAAIQADERERYERLKEQGKAPEKFEFSKSSESDMPMNVLLCFLYVASHNPCRSSDIQKEFDWSAASVTRNTDWLTRQRTKNEKGLNLITKEVDQLNKRFRILKLTPEGEALANLYHSLHG